MKGLLVAVSAIAFCVCAAQAAWCPGTSLLHTAWSITSIYEWSTTTPDYASCESIWDYQNQGITCGLGFTTGSGDATLAVQEYGKLKPGNSLTTKVLV